MCSRQMTHGDGAATQKWELHGVRVTVLDGGTWAGGIISVVGRHHLPSFSLSTHPPASPEMLAQWQSVMTPACTNPCNSVAIPSSRFAYHVSVHGHAGKARGLHGPWSSPYLPGGRPCSTRWGGARCLYAPLPLFACLSLDGFICEVGDFPDGYTRALSRNGYRFFATELP